MLRFPITSTTSDMQIRLEAQRCLLSSKLFGSTLKMVRAHLSQLIQIDRTNESLTNNVPKLIHKYSVSAHTELEFEAGNLSQNKRLLNVDALEKLQLTVIVSGVDESVLDSYTPFLKPVAKIIKQESTIAIVAPISCDTRSFLASGVQLQHCGTVESNVRLLQAQEVHSTNADVLVEYIGRSIPDGASMSVDKHIRYGSWSRV